MGLEEARARRPQGEKEINGKSERVGGRAIRGRRVREDPKGPKAPEVLMAQQVLPA